MANYRDQIIESVRDVRRFSVQSVDELPGITPEKVEDFKAEAEDEIQLKLNL